MRKSRSMTSLAMLAVKVVLVCLPVCLEARVWEIGLPPHLQDCYNKVARADIATYVGSTFSWFCETAIKSSQSSGPKQFDSQKMNYYQQLYQKSIEVTHHPTSGRRHVRGKRQAGQGRCVRKEYRMLTDMERRRFHAAINGLKSDTSVEPNKYDAIALLHTGMAAFNAHGGAGFPGWHRIYILMFESALREVDPSVCLHYWDSTLDNELDDPSTSNIWSSDFFGTPNGAVVDGPFAGWMTPEGSQLMRNVATDGELLTRVAIEDILSRTSHAQIITSADTDPRFDIEFHHAAVHVFCGGTMGQLDTAAFDPIFFIHHSFVDYVWEMFRTNLRGLGIDPNLYPDVEDIDSRHHGTANTGFGELTQADGFSDQMIESYEYESSPVCGPRSRSCGSRFLTCRVSTRRCIPVNPSIVVQRPIPNPNPNPIIDRHQGQSPHTNPIIQHDIGGTSCARTSPLTYGRPVQNDYCCDQTCDTNQWAMVPVKIVSVRPPKFTNYQSFPVKNGRIDNSFDIYSPSASSKTSRFISRRQGNPKTFSRCQDDTSTGQVFLSSKGINYDGYYKEATIIDQRQAVSISMGYIAVKQPTRGNRGITRALLRAHDSCGRVCHVACRDPNTNEFGPCSGAVAISTDTPRMYGNTYEEALLDVFQYDFDNNCPRFNTDNFFITFYCDYHNDFPYVDRAFLSTRKQAPPRPVVVKTKPVAVSVIGGCRVNSDCVLDVACVSEFRQCSLYNEMHVCRGSCRAYGQCSYGRYFLRVCPEGQYFDDVNKQCISGFCRKSQVGGARILSPSGLTGRGSSSGRLQSYQHNSGTLGGRVSPVSGNSYQEMLTNRITDYSSNNNSPNVVNSQANRRISNSRDVHSHDYAQSQPLSPSSRPSSPKVSSRRSGYADMISDFLRRRIQGKK